MAMSNLKLNAMSILRDLWSFLKFLFYSTQKGAMAVIRYLKLFNYASALQTFLKNIKVFSNSKSIYFIALFLPIILTFIVGISINASHNLNDNVAYFVEDDSPKVVTDFISNLKTEGLTLKEYISAVDCVGSVQTSKSSACLYFSDFQVDNVSDKITFSIGEKKQSDSARYLAAINSSMVSSVQTNAFSDAISIMKINIEDREFPNLVLNIFLFFIMFLTIMFASVIFYYEKPEVSEFFSNPDKFKKLVLEVFFSTFTLFFTLGLVLLFILSLLLSFLSLGAFLWMVLLLMLSVALFSAIGLLIGMLTSSEDMNLFVSMSLASIFVFLSDLILPMSSVIPYFATLNPYAMSAMLFKHLVLLSSRFGVISYEFTYIFAYLLLFILIFVAVGYMFINKDERLKLVLADKEDDFKWLEDHAAANKMPKIHTEELSLSQYKRLEELRKVKMQHSSEVKATYKDVVNVKIQKKVETEEPKVESRGKAATERKEEKRREEKKKEEYVKEERTKEDKTKDKKQREKVEAESLIETIEIENEVLSLKSQGLSEKQIIEKLKSRYDEEDIEQILESQSK